MTVIRTLVVYISAPLVRRSNARSGYQPLILVANSLIDLRRQL
jgi:hypothetical protein